MRFALQNIVICIMSFVCICTPLLKFIETENIFLTMLKTVRRMVSHKIQKNYTIIHNKLWNIKTNREREREKRIGRLCVCVCMCETVLIE